MSTEHQIINIKVQVPNLLIKTNAKRICLRYFKDKFLSQNGRLDFVFGRKKKDEEQKKT